MMYYSNVINQQMYVYCVDFMANFSWLYVGDEHGSMMCSTYGSYS